MKHEPDVTKKDKNMLHGIPARENDSEWSTSDHEKLSTATERKEYHRDPHLGHAAGDYEPLQHPEKMHTSENTKHKMADSKKIDHPPLHEMPTTSAEQMDESLHLLMQEELHVAEIEQMRASYGTQGLDRQ